MRAAATSERSAGAGTGAAIPRDDFRAALDHALGAADSDERIGAALRATPTRMRLEFPDCDLALNVSTAPSGLEWSFADDPGWEPKLELRMDSAVANAYLQGRANLPIAVARGSAQCNGSSLAALQCLPLTRLLAGPYRAVVRSEFPALEV